MRCFLTVLVAGLLGATHANVFTGDWLELIDTTKLPILRDAKTLQVSSYDRTGGNDDGFSGTYSFLRKEDDAFVIFEDEGPGCVYRIWSANPGARRIEFYFDGEEVPRLVFDKWEDMFLGKVEPFLPPVSDHVIGGWISYVPMPYRESLKIVTRDRINFYQITYQKFANDENVRTFTPELSEADRQKFEQVREAWRNLGEHPWPQAIDDYTESTVVAQPGKEASLLRLPGTGMLHALKLRVECDDPRWLRKAIISISADGQKPQVQAPFGDFFLHPFRGQNVQSLLAGRDPSDPNVFYAYWPMPYVDSIQVLLDNQAGAPISVGVVAGYENRDAIPFNVGRFHAKWLRQNPTIEGELFPILDAWGRGHWCGVSIGMQGFQPGLGYLEGDELLWIDDRDHHSFNGTGSEDYYNGGWYFGTTGSFPYFGCGLHNEPAGRCHAFRLHMTDIVPYQEQARIGIEHGHANEYQADYAGTTFWYAEPGGRAIIPEMAAANDRLWLPKKRFGFQEAEALLAEGSAASVADHEDWLDEFSSGEAVELAAPGAQAEMIVTPDANDVYRPTLVVAPAEPDTVIEVTVKGTPERSAEFSFDEAVPGGKEIHLPKLRINAQATPIAVTLKNGRCFVDALRLEPSEKLSNVIEAEYLDVESIRRGIAERLDVFDADDVSGDSALVVVAGKSAGIAWPVDIPADGIYEVVIRAGAGGGDWQLRIDGEDVGEPISAGGKTGDWHEPILVGLTPSLDAGEHRIELLATNLGAVLTLDYIRITPQGQREGEQLPVRSAQGGPADVQNMTGFGGAWSGGAQMWFRPSSADAVLELEVSVLESGTYDVCGAFTKAPDYGIYAITVDGNTLPETFDGYAPSVQHSGEFCFGSLELEKGLHVFRFECQGKSDNSSSYMLGIDALTLKKQ